MTEVCVVFVTVGNGEQAARIGRALVEEKLAACVNIVPGIRSIYHWKGEICEDEELLLIMKTPCSLFVSVQNRVRELHSYDVPEIIAFPIAQGLPEYLDWVFQSTHLGD